MLIRLKTLRRRSSEPSLRLLLAPYTPPSMHSPLMRIECHPVRRHAQCADDPARSVGQRS